MIDNFKETNNKGFWCQWDKPRRETEAKTKTGRKSMNYTTSKTRPEDRSYPRTCTFPDDSFSTDHRTTAPITS